MNYRKHLCKTVILLKLDNIFKRQILKWYNILLRKSHRSTLNPEILYCYLLANLFCKKNYSKKKIFIIPPQILKLYQKRLVFMQLKSSDTQERCSIAFRKVSNTINSINLLKHFLHCSKAVLIRVADVMASTRGEKQGYHSGGFCFSLHYQKICRKRLRVLFFISSFYFSSLCFCKFS